MVAALTDAAALAHIVCGEKGCARSASKLGCIMRDYARACAIEGKSAESGFISLAADSELVA